ncbi:cytochrome c [Erwinia sp. INIA-01]|uniref:c-type cytochrome n=1 Tax=Erwinia sp. INIA01 TaxID=2991500 RepID=UPI002224EEDA|nr:cytochrome c [Erwinia sp. INIA01]MCW1873943.1 cytochrome c [Erwinia sp. INIA01]
MNRWKKKALSLSALVLAAGAVLLVFSLQPEIAPVAPPQASQFSAEQIARGKTLAALGDCKVCHTRAGGQVDAGGMAFNTQFGTIYSSNITPDVATGIGSWSYPAFKRAMRYGINREGHYLYPAFPYTSFTLTRDDDLQDLYAWLMVQPAVSYRPPKTELHFPFNVRQGMFAWNWLFLTPGPFPVNPQQSEEWNRGAYLGESLGHCSACHSPRNLAGAEKDGSHHLSGGIVDGWSVPALNSHSPAPIAWNHQQLMQFMRTGFASSHGVAAGPMAPVIAEGLSQLPEDDLKAIATWLASFQPPWPDHGKEVSIQAEQQMMLANSPGARQFAGSCMACHAQNTGPKLYGVRPSLMLNSNLYSDSPDNLIRIVLDGIQNPATPELGSMPGFRYQLNNQQIAVLLNYLRTDLAQRASWPDLQKRIEQIRQQTEDKS